MLLRGGRSPAAGQQQLTQEQQQALGSISHGVQAKELQDALKTQRAAIECIPIEWRSDPPSDAKAKKLLEFFKAQFFKWVNEPDCQYCGPDASNKLKFQRMRGPTSPPEVAGLASRVEVYRCDKCANETVFPRYNDPVTLMRTRQGRCGEWANCFCALAVAAGFNTRFVLDLTDHVWAEIYSPDQKRWIHCDPCENAFDSPLMYEAGWNKKLSWVFAFESGGVCRDVTRRYSRSWDPEMLQRRVKHASMALTRALTARAASRWTESEENEFKKCIEETLPSARRKQRTSKQKPELKPEEARGRVSGSEEWRRQRGELGDDKKEFQVRYQLLLAQGKSANEAAAQALKEMMEQKRRDQQGDAQCSGPQCTSLPTSAGGEGNGKINDETANKKKDPRNSA